MVSLTSMFSSDWFIDCFRSNQSASLNFSSLSIEMKNCPAYLPNDRKSPSERLSAIFCSISDDIFATFRSNKVEFDRLSISDKSSSVITSFSVGLKTFLSRSTKNEPRSKIESIICRKKTPLS